MIGFDLLQDVTPLPFVDWDAIAPMVVFVVLILVAGGVLVLRPLVNRLGPLFEAMTREKIEGRSSEDVRAIRDSVELMAQRLDLLEERQAFTENLLGASRKNPGEIPAASGRPEEIPAARKDA